METERKTFQINYLKKLGEPYYDKNNPTLGIQKLEMAQKIVPIDFQGSFIDYTLNHNINRILHEEEIEEWWNELQNGDKKIEALKPMTVGTLRHELNRYVDELEVWVGTSAGRVPLKTFELKENDIVLIPCKLEELK